MRSVIAFAALVVVLGAAAPLSESDNVEDVLRTAHEMSFLARPVPTLVSQCIEE